MFANVLSYLSILVSLLVLDGLWIGLVMGKLFKKHLAHVLTHSVAWPPVAIFYLLYAFGIAYFVVWGASHTGHWLAIFGAGVLFGVIAYGTFDLTNQAIITGWPTFITVLDMTWGGIYTGIAAILGVLVKRLALGMLK